jgi:hypothetical protein
VFWDDWIWMHLDRGSLLQMTEQIGYPLLGPLHLVLRHMGVETYRWIIFLSYLAASVAVFKTLRHVPKLDSQKRLYLALLFAVFPVNSARIAVSDIHYAIAYGVFFVGLWLFSEFTDRGGVWLRLSSLLLIGWASCIVNSLLFFCLLVPVLFLYVRSGYSSVHAAVSRLKQIPDFILLPPVVFALKQLSKPFGLYTHYNKVSLHYVAHSPLAIGAALYRSFLQVIAHAVRVSHALHRMDIERFARCRRALQPRTSGDARHTRCQDVPHQPIVRRFDLRSRCHALCPGWQVSQPLGLE